MEQSSPELEAILHEVERALDAKLYYLAIAVTLSVPDICACLEFDPNNPRWANGETYANWWDANLGGRYRNIEGIDVYRIRGGTLHKGSFGHAKSRFNRVMFIGPESRIKSHDVVVTVEPGVQFGGISAEELRLSGKLLLLDAQIFCLSVLDAARVWAAARADDPFVAANMKNLVRFRPEGLPPFSIGVPTIA